MVLGQQSDLTIDAEVSFVDNEASVVGSNLWKLGIFGSRNLNGRGQRIGEKRQIFRANEASTPLDPRTADGLHRLNINNIRTTFDMSSIGCGAFPYLCVEFGQADRPRPTFEFATEDGTDSVVNCKLLQCENGEQENYWYLI